MATSIKQLSELIANSVDRLVDTYDANNAKLPGLDDHYNPDTEIALRDKISGDVNLIISAAMQLIATVSHPELSVYRIANAHVKTAALHTAIVAHVPEILREAGPQGMHCDAIAQFTGIDGGKLGRILRLLVSCHVFREVKPNVFVNNRLSETMDTGRSVKGILAAPDRKHDNGEVFPALMEYLSEENLKISTGLADSLMDTETTHSQEINHAAFQRAFQTDLTYWEWLDQPQQDYRRRRFGVAMPGAFTNLWPPLALTAFEWDALPAGSVVVDVGGGLGFGRYSMDIAMQHPNLQIIVQQSGPFVEEGQKFWEAKSAEPYISGRFKFQVHNFFTPQPQNNASVFFFQNILTFLPNKYALKVLGALRQAATKDTKLLITSTVIKYACTDPEMDDSVPGSVIAEAPRPLSSNYMADRQFDFAYIQDISIMAGFNGKERTFKESRDIVERSGWRIVRVNQSDAGYDLLQAVPL